jgi:hypothetical protein
MNSWAKMKEKDWLTEDGPRSGISAGRRHGGRAAHRQSHQPQIVRRRQTHGVPQPRRTHQQRVYIQDRYEANINEVYGRLDGNPCAGFDNCTPADARPENPLLPPAPGMADAR